MTAALTLPHISIDDYLAGELTSEVKHEYLGGRVYMMAGGRIVHHEIAGNFFGSLYTRLKGKNCRPYNSDNKVRIQFSSHTRFYYPDGLVVCHRSPPNQTYQDHPVVIAEVLSDSTRRTDEGEKREAYLTIPSLQVYLLIETDRPRVVVHRRGEHGFEAELHEGIDAVISLGEIEAELPLAELYERVDFAAAE